MPPTLISDGIELRMKTIPQRELRNRIGEILRQAEAGSQFSITVNDRPVAVLGPQPKPQCVAKGEFLKILASQAPDPSFREDVAGFGGTVSDMEDQRLK